MAAVKADWFRADDARIDELDRLLEQRAVPFGGYGLEQLDGFLTAIAVSPGTVAPEEWLPLVWGKAPPRWEGPADEAAATALLMLAWETAQRRVRTPGDELTVEGALFWWLPDDPEAEHGDEVDIGAAWAGGFLDGMALRDAGWDEWIAKDDWIGEVEDYIEGLAVGSYPPETEGGAPVPLPYRERLEIHASLPDMLHDLHVHRIESLTPREPVRRAAMPERNDPCPCGSGKKYKKCCAP
ncbi:MAG: UPF0149 family protein [Rhizobium sp.]|nr:UPF0149 family protein [Rhizobium sp.]